MGIIFCTVLSVTPVRLCKHLSISSKKRISQNVQDRNAVLCKMYAAPAVRHDNRPISAGPWQHRAAGPNGSDKGFLWQHIAIVISAEGIGEGTWNRRIARTRIIARVWIRIGLAACIRIGHGIIGVRIGISEGVISTVRLAVGIIPIGAIIIVDLSQVF
jgi:hypothetical protein